MDFYDDNEDIYNSSLYEDMGMDEVGLFNQSFANTKLKAGIVVKVIEQDEDRNLTKLGPEYDVLVVEQDENRGSNTVIYPNAVMSDGFGNVADFLDVKRRAKEEEKNGSNEEQNVDFNDQLGSIVLILCLDGSDNKSVIIGTLKHPSRSNLLSKEAGIHLEGEFNGIRWNIDKEGAFNFIFKGATDNKGKPKDSKAAGSFIKVEKDGSIEVGDADIDSDLGKGNMKKDGSNKPAKTGTGKYEKIRLDKTNQTIDVEARKDIGITTDANLNIESKGKTNHKAASHILEAMGSAETKAGTWKVESQGPAEIKAAAGQFEFSGMLQIKSPTTIVSSNTIMLGDGGTPAMTLNTLYLGISPHYGIPVVSFAIGPFSSKVFIAP